MQRNKKETKISEIRATHKRICEIQDEINKLPRVKLDKKIFAGHWRFLKVRSDVLRSSIGKQVEQVVNACNTHCLGKKKDPSTYKTATETCYPINGSLINGGITWKQGQGLRPLNKDQYENANFPEHFKTKWFDVLTTYIKAGTKNIPVERYFPKIPPHMLEYDYKPAYITEVKPSHGDLESELAKHYRFMNNNNGWQVIYDNIKDEWDLSLDKKKKLTKLKDKEIKEALEDIG
jgi:hypothetical protein